MKLKEEFKRGLAIVVGVIIVVILAVSIEIGTNKAIEQCVAGGQSRNVCESGLK